MDGGGEVFGGPRCDLFQIKNLWEVTKTDTLVELEEFCVFFFLVGSDSESSASGPIVRGATVAGATATGADGGL